MTTRVLSLPGWNGSGPLHWQTLWERLDARVVRVEQASWAEPSLEAWLSRVDAALADGEPTVLLGHSLGAVLAVHAARLESSRAVVGALLVAPPALEGPVPGAPAGLASFAPVPLRPLPFPSVLVHSTNDAFLTAAGARAYAVAWGSERVELGAVGHVNAESGLGAWAAGFELLRRLRARAAFRVDPRLEAESSLVAEGPLSQLRLVDELRYPWCVLVPRVSAAEDVRHLDEAQRSQLEAETHAVVAAVAEAFSPDKVNVAALGNVVRQLHVHVVARRLGDEAWPGPVWGRGPRVPASSAELGQRRARLLETLRGYGFRPLG
ncbi:MAG: alpha/beta hydrolase [Myxococcaceae bacterium]|nr:alpha/beta hydrolase [Myxococcaceae bacterium]